MKKDDPKTNDLIKRLNRYSLEDKAKLCLLLSLDSIDYLLDYSTSKKSVTPPWLVDGFATLCVLSNPTTSFHKNIFIEGIKDKNYIFRKLYNQIPPQSNEANGDLAYLLNPIVNMQINYQKNDDIFFYRYSFLFSFLKKDFLVLTKGVEYEKFIVLARLFSIYKRLYKEGTDVFLATKELLRYMPELIEPLGISRDDLILKTKEMLSDLNDLGQFAYSFKFISSYPFVSYDDNWYFMGIHNIFNSITTGFMNRIIDSKQDLSAHVGKVLEKYIFHIINNSGLVSSIEDDSIPYYIGKKRYDKPDVSFEQDGYLVIIESKKASSSLKTAYNDEEEIKKEKDKGLQACVRSLNNYVRFLEGKYTLCNKHFSDYKKVFLVICTENETFWPKVSLINEVKSKREYSTISDFIDNNLVITSLYNIETYFLYGKSILGELLRNKPSSEKNSLLKNSGNHLKRSKQLQDFVDKEQEMLISFQNELDERVKTKTFKS